MKLIILDRDGVINYDSDNFIKTVDEWIPLPGSLEAIARLSKNSYKIAVVTNQSGIARQFYNVDTLHQMHNKFRRLLAEHGGTVDAIYFCPHGPDDYCNCRKPKTGMYEKVSNRFQTSLANTFTIGDSFRDLEAAMTMKSNPILVKTGKGEATLQKHKVEISNNNIPVYQDLAEFVNKILN